ncbi:MAG: lysylphosphatidylglycerol synthase domain-containing protein, partial [Deltaproteobacteria bacterium]|nr:lysylphosphatidylglycerol synthase domain-containing protein [Deltaproteobacteria bacterium]
MSTLLKRSIPSGGKNWRDASQWGGAFAGFLLLAHVLARIGKERLLNAFQAMAWSLPIAFLLDGLRIACDAWSTRLVLGEVGRKLNWRPLLHAQLMAHAVMNLLPAGRAAGEALKALLFQRTIGGSVATAMAAINQAVVFASSAIFALLCGVVTLHKLGASWLGWAIVLHGSTLALAAFGLRAATLLRSPIEGIVLRFPRLREAVVRFFDSSRLFPPLPWFPVVAMMLGRTAQG